MDGVGRVLHLFLKASRTQSLCSITRLLYTGAQTAVVCRTTFPGIAGDNHEAGYHCPVHPCPHSPCRIGIRRTGLGRLSLCRVPGTGSRSQIGCHAGGQDVQLSGQFRWQHELAPLGTGWQADRRDSTRLRAEKATGLRGQQTSSLQCIQRRRELEGRTAIGPAPWLLALSATPARAQQSEASPALRDW